jgi:hypothetical protein
MSIMSRYPEIIELTYEQARNEIKSGDVLLCSGNTMFSKLIQRATGSMWSHVGFILRLDAIDRIMVMESVESIGVRTVPLSSYVSNYNGSRQPYDGRLLIARHRHFNPDRVHDLSKTAVDLLGHNYSAKEIARITYRITVNLGRNYCNLPEPDDEYICSEYAYECFKSVGIYIPTSCGYVTPADFSNAEDIEPVCGLITN